MKRYFWFAIFNCIGVFCIGCTFSNMNIGKLLALVIGIQCIATGLDFLDHLNKED